MDICLASLHPKVLSGQIDSLAGLGRALTQRGHAVTLVAPFDTDGLLDRSLISLDAGAHRLTGAAMKMLRTIPRVVAAANEADILHLALPTPAFSWIGDIVQRRTNTPVIISYEGHLAPGGQLLRPSRLRRSWRTYLPLWGVNNGMFGRMTGYTATRYVVSSEFQRRELEALGAPAARLAVLSNVVETAKLVRCLPDDARRQLHLPEGKKLIGYIGHFNDVKGVDVLTRAFAALAKRQPEAHLVLAWSGQGDAEPVRAPLAGLEDRVSWLGKVHVGTFLGALDVLALPYRCTAGQGAYPSLVIEALHAACPLVTSRLPLLEELLGETETALLCPPEQPTALAAQLETLLVDVTRSRRMQAAQRRVARTRFASDVLASEYETLYQAVAPGEIDTLTTSVAA
jgi:glycosyltransferase involved in cell wall biosynthesis